ncbi:hypothetical protein GCM10023340_19530 [Nocardioides marinquilinus]|uniref:Uncharacterized protein n=1 Tax=Nocardioides marinquilinus TaxID=1210400 RepID=A0ABP9PIY9_9ACTN
MPEPIPADPSPSQQPWDAPGSPSQPSAPMGAGMGRPSTPPKDHPQTAVPPDSFGTGSPVRDLVLTWLLRDGRQLLHYSDVTKGVCGRGRAINRLAASPRQAVRDALHQLAHEGRVRLSPTTYAGRAGQPGLVIEVINELPPKDASTHEGNTP